MMSFRVCFALTSLSRLLATANAVINATNTTVANNQTASSGDLWNLLKAACIIMTIIMLGYMARLSGYILPDAERGIGAIAGRVALPALLANSIAKADIAGFIDEGGLKVVAIDLVCKGVVVLLAMVIALFQRSEIPKLSLMGVYGVFVTNSNYMAVGVPLISAIFGPQKILYLIFFAMVQNVLVNPLLFALILFGLKKAETTKIDEERGERASSSTHGRKVMKDAMIRVATDPIVVAAAIGLIYNLSTLTERKPLNGIIPGVLEKLANAFSLCALFNIGMGIVGHVHSIATRSVVVPLILILLKSLVLPMLEKSLGEFFLAEQMTDVLWVAGCISTAASTALITTAFIPSLGGILRGATVLNLLMSLPLLILSQTLFKSSDQARGEITQYGRICGNILSMGGLAMLLLNFYAVKRWRIYPMWLIVDLAIVGLPFYVGHYFCHIVKEIVPFPQTLFYVLYFVTNVSRLARRFYMMSLSFILLAQVLWYRWFPSIPYGYVKQAEAAGPVEGGGYQCAYHKKMRQLHWGARILSVVMGLVGTLPFMLFTPLHSLSGFSCWCAYGVPQWITETASFSFVSLVQGIALVSYLSIKSRRAWQRSRASKMFPKVRFGIATLLILQLVAVLVHLVILCEILEIGQENFQVDPVWLQPLVVLILVTDGGGFVLMFIFATSDATWETYKKLFYSAWVKMAGPRETRTLRLYALQMATDAKLLDFHNPDGVHLQNVNAFSGCDAVDWMLEHGNCTSRQEATTQCLLMFGKNLIVAAAEQPLVGFVDAEDYTYTINQPKLGPKLLKRGGKVTAGDVEEDDLESDCRARKETGSTALGDDDDGHECTDDASGRDGSVCSTLSHITV